LKPIYAKIIGQRIEIQVWRGQMGRNLRIEWLLAPANKKNDCPLAPAMALAHTSINWVPV